MLNMVPIKCSTYDAWLYILYNEHDVHGLKSLNENVRFLILHHAYIAIFVAHRYALALRSTAYQQ